MGKLLEFWLSKVEKIHRSSISRVLWGGEDKKQHRHSGNLVHIFNWFINLWVLPTVFCDLCLMFCRKDWKLVKQIDNLHKTASSPTLFFSVFVVSPLQMGRKKNRAWLILRDFLPPGEHGWLQFLVLCKGPSQIHVKKFSGLHVFRETGSPVSLNYPQASHRIAL